MRRQPLEHPPSRHARAHAHATAPIRRPGARCRRLARRRRRGGRQQRGLARLHGRPRDATRAARPVARNRVPALVGQRVDLQREPIPTAVLPRAGHPDRRGMRATGRFGLRRRQQLAEGARRGGARGRHPWRRRAARRRRRLHARSLHRARAAPSHADRSPASGRRLQRLRGRSPPASPRRPRSRSRCCSTSIITLNVRPSAPISSPLVTRTWAWS